MHVQGKNILITGASSGIGAAAALEAARQGASPILVARRKKQLEETRERIASETGIKSLMFECDVTSQADRRALAKFLATRIKDLPILINNAGITAHGRFDRTKPEVLEKTMELNFYSVAYLTQELLPLMRKTEGQKKIILVSTPSALHGIAGRFAYSASKAAGHACIETIRIELSDEKFDTLLFCPGYTRTDLRTSGLSADGSTLDEEQSKEARSPEEVATRLLQAIKKDKRIAFTSLHGPLVFYLRTLAPALLEMGMRKKLKKDFQR